MLISGIAGINPSNGEPFKNTRMLIETFTETKDLDILKLLKQCIPDAYYRMDIKRVLRYIEFDLGINVNVKTLNKPFDQVLDTCYYGTYLNEHIEYGCFEFKDREYLLYRICGEPTLNLIELSEYYSIKDFIAATKDFNVSILGEDGYHTYNTEGGGCWNEERSDGSGGELSEFDSHVKFLSLMETHYIVSDSEFGIEMRRNG